MSRARVDIRLATAGALAAELMLVASSLARSQEESTWPYVLVGGIVGVACARATRASATARRVSVVAPVSSALVVLLASPLRTGVAFLVGSGDPGALRLAFGRGVVGLVAAVASGLITLRGARAARAAGVGRSLAVEALGAALGIGVVGYELVPRLGMRMAVLIAAGLDVALLLLSRAYRNDVVEVSAPGNEPSSARRAAGDLATGAVVGALVTEWLRLLPLVSADTATGAPLPTCALLLCFAAGCALAGRAKTPSPSLVVAAEAAAGAALLLGLPAWPAVSSLFYSGAEYAPGAPLFFLLRLAAVLGVVGVPALVLGARLSLRRAGDPWWAGGAVLGSAATFLLAPLLGAQGSLTLLGLALVLLAVVSVAALDRPRPQRLAIGAASLVAAALLVVLVPPWDLARVDGGAATSFRRPEGRSSTWIPFAEDLGGAPVIIVSAPVEASAASGPLGRSLVLLHDGTAAGGDATGGTSARLARIARLFLGARAPGPAPAALLVGLGTGAALEAIASPLFGFARLDVVEPSAGIVDADRTAFAGAQGSRLDDPRVHLEAEDARAFFLRPGSAGRYRLVLDSTLSPSLRRQEERYTVDGYRAVARVLAESGVFAQTIPLERTASLDVARILADARQAFPALTLWLVDGKLLLVGSREPLIADAADLRTWGAAPASAPGVAAPAPSFTLFANLLASDAGIDRFVADEARSAGLDPTSLVVTDDSCRLAAAASRDESRVGAAAATLAALRAQTDATLSDHVRGLTDARERAALYAAAAAAHGWSRVAAAELQSP